MIKNIIHLYFQVDRENFPIHYLYSHHLVFFEEVLQNNIFAISVIRSKHSTSLLREALNIITPK